jgi:transcriptional regulator with XRE-family HTH domain
MDPRDPREAFAANLRRLRHEKGISQDDLAYGADLTDEETAALARLRRDTIRDGFECT